MKLMPYRPGALLLALSALAALAVSSGPAAADADPEPRHRPHFRHTAAEISRFLADFYGEHGPTNTDRRLRISQQLKDKQSSMPGADVLLCAQNTPQSGFQDAFQGAPRTISVGPATIAQSARVGWATVTTSWESGATDTFTAYVRLDSRPIQLDDVICAG
ncbi:hypothetical protein OOK31_14670 [Streptomyces sp. NBC_00249]|uniref:hypothetical protein n=1 Tax=Streptomyces sp. NBC_00249 TaxID=2975690 RepID=UPI002253142B|nr:hypothetical protein [Streptomyces sp. NBC_00249]MCX5195129.1 hypothetical protein [Streptomyces sp. NBC_00249]